MAKKRATSRRAATAVEAGQAASPFPPPAAPAPLVPDRTTLIRNYLAAKSAGGESYKLADMLFEQLKPLVGVGEVIDLGEGQVVTLIDNFAVKNKVFKPCGVSRFDLKVGHR